MSKLNSRLLCALFLIMIVSVWPISGLFANISPPFILLFVLYIQIFNSKLFGLTWVFLLGLYCDALFVSTMGEHVLALLFPCWIMSSTSNRFIFLSVLQQLLLILVCCFIYQLVIYGVDAFVGNSQPFWWGLCSSLLGMVFWPWFRLALEYRVKII